MKFHIIDVRIGLIRYDSVFQNIRIHLLTYYFYLMLQYKQYKQEISSNEDLSKERKGKVNI
ncbi:hypothetical protein pb186bvf_011545 [Paramecium bursaria]